MGDCGAILVVDEDPESRTLLVKLLPRLGYPTRQAATGEAALGAGTP